MALKIKIKRKLKLKPKLSEQELDKKDQEKRTRNAFRLSGFRRISGVSNKNISFLGTDCDLDDVLIYENIVVLIEYTVSKSDISKHLKHKKVFFDLVDKNQIDFVQMMEKKFPQFAAALNDLYQPQHYRVFILYASRYPLSESTKLEVPSVLYLDYNVIRYLEGVSSTVRRSARHEIFAFLGLKSSEIGENVVKVQGGFVKCEGSVLPEAHSGFDPGFKVVSCYMSPEDILSRAYVLRRDSWRAGSFYQRMILQKKIQNIRGYLQSKERVFINNVIVTLSEDTKILDEKGNTVDVKSIKKTTPAWVQLSNEHSSIGIIDGQHRIFSYYEGDGADDEPISILRKRQNLLVTGVIFPDDITAEARLRFEANLFLEINSTQTNAKSDLRQEIELLLNPYSTIAIAKRVINTLNDKNGPLSNKFQRTFYDEDMMKTTSVVSYALQYLVRPGGADSFYGPWDHELKKEILSGTNDALLDEYIQYCAAEINKFMSAIKSLIPADRWTADKKQKGYFLTTAHINGCLNCLRNIVRFGHIKSYASYKESMSGLDKFEFHNYKSSQYTKLGTEMYKKYFE